MIFRHFLTEANESDIYIAGCEATREAVLIDAGAFDKGVVEFVRRKRLLVKAILLTHSHRDHTGGAEEFEVEFGCPALGAPRLKAGGAFDFGKLSIRILNTSGHTPDSLSFYIASERAIFTGDALFAGSVGGASAPDRHAEELGNIRANILTLPEETIVFPGHGPASTVGTEKACNPFLQMNR